MLIKFIKRLFGIGSSEVKDDDNVWKKNEEKYLLFFDTETTGLPKDYKAPSSDTDNWPRLVQLSWILTTEVGEEVGKGDYIVKPSGFIIPDISSSIHGISTEKAMSEGKPLEDVLNAFMKDFNKSTIIVGHNIDFDKKIVGCELIRTGKKDLIADKPSICTMKSTVEFCKIPGKIDYKYPKLQELHFKLFNNYFEDAHNSACDISATKKCYFELKKRGIL